MCPQLVRETTPLPEAEDIGPVGPSAHVGIAVDEVHEVGPYPIAHLMHPVHVAVGWISQSTLYWPSRAPYRLYACNLPPVSRMFPGRFARASLVPITRSGASRRAVAPVLREVCDQPCGQLARPRRGGSSAQYPTQRVGLGSLLGPWAARARGGPDAARAGCCRRRSRRCQRIRENRKRGHQLRRPLVSSDSKGSSRMPPRS